MDLESNSVHISRNVIFNEHIFPYVISSQPLASQLDDFIFPHYTSDNRISILASNSSLPPIQPLVTPPLPSIPTETSTDFIGTSTNISAEPTTEPIVSTELIPSNSISDPIQSESPLSIPPSPILRRSTRPHNPPLYLSEYSCKSVNTKPGPGLP